MDASSLNGTDLSSIVVSVIRTGFSTHAMNMGMRQLILEHSYTGNSNGSATLHVAMPPPNAALLVPGPVLFFVTINGIPSQGSYAMLGSGVIEAQTMNAASVLPASSGNFANSSSSPSSSAGSVGSTAAKTNGAAKTAVAGVIGLLGVAAVLLC